MIVAIVALLLGVRVVGQVLAADSYAAVCVDVRTMTRVEPVTACEGQASSNYRWWYVAKGQTVPAASAPVNPNTGTMVQPGSGSDITYGFNPEGGTVGG